MKRVTIIMLGSLVSAALLVWIALSVDLHEMRVAVSHMQWKWLPLMVAATLTAYVCRGLRWQLMLLPLKRIPLRVCCGFVFIGFMANSLLPARLGEFARAVGMARHRRIKVVSSLTSIVLERVLDGLVLVMVLFTVMRLAGLAPEHRDTVTAVGIAAGSIFVTAAILVLVGRIRPAWVQGLVNAVTAILPSRAATAIRDACARSIEALAFLRINRGLIAILMLSMCVWLLEGTFFTLGMYAFGLSFDPVIGMFTLALTLFANMLPSAPAGVGLYHASIIIALGCFGVDRSVAASYAFIIHGTAVLSVVAAGMLSLWLLGLRWRALTPGAR